MRISVIAILITMFVAANAAPIDTILYNKVQSTIPNVDQGQFNALIKNAGQWGSFFARYSPRDQIHTITGINFDINVGGKSHNLTPFSDFGALKWGTRIEHLSSKLYVSGAGGLSYGIVTASVGERSGDHILMRTGYGWSHGNTNQMYNDVRYKSCKRRVFKKKCKWKTKKVARGLNTQEVNTVQMGMIKNAHIGALTKIPKSLTSAPLLQAGNNTGNSNILFGVNANEVIQAVTSLVHGTGTPTLVNNLRGYVTSPRKGAFTHTSSKGTFKINLEYTANKYVVTVSL
jgi:hypothetical protein